MSVLTEQTRTENPMMVALHSAIRDSVYSTACIFRDGERVVTVLFNGDGYDVQTPKRRTHPLHLVAVAKRLIREGYSPPEVNRLTEAWVEIERVRPTKEEIGNVATTYLRNLGVSSYFGTVRYEGMEAVLTCLDDLNEKTAVLHLARLDNGVIVTNYKPIPHRCGFCGEPLSHDEIQREVIRHDACDANEQNIERGMRQLDTAITSWRKHFG